MSYGIQKALNLIAGTVGLGDQAAANAAITRFDAMEANKLASGEGTFDRDLQWGTSGVATGQLRLTYWTARKTETVTQVKITTNSTAAAATPTVCRIGIYSIDAAGAGTLVASIANDTTLFAGANTDYTRTFTVPLTKVRGQRYATGLLVVTAAAVPTFLGFSGATGAVSSFALAPRLCGHIISLADLPSSFVDAGIVANASRHYSIVLP